eukprot:Gb_39101 [translate_table: standard]
MAVDCFSRELLGTPPRWRSTEEKHDIVCQIIFQPGSEDNLLSEFVVLLPAIRDSYKGDYLLGTTRVVTISALRNRLDPSLLQHQESRIGCHDEICPPPLNWIGGLLLLRSSMEHLGESDFFHSPVIWRLEPLYLLCGYLEQSILLVSRKWTHLITTILFFAFGFWSLWEGITEEGGESEELAEVEAKLTADLKENGYSAKAKVKANKAFSLTFFGEWGDKSQIATIGLAADENAIGVVLGGVVGQALCTTAAVFGGKSLASRISERMVAVSGGILFVVFGIQSLLTKVESA